MEKRTIKPIWKWVIGLMAGIVILVLVAGWYVGKRWKPLLDEQLRQTVLSATDSLYHVSYDDLSFNLLTGNVALKNFRLRTDSVVYAGLELAVAAPDNRMDATVDVVSIKGLNIAKAILSKKIIAEAVVLDRPTVILRNKYHFYNDTVSVERDGSNVLGSLNELQVDRVLLRDVDFTFSKWQDSTENSYQFQRVTILLEDVLIDSTSVKDSERFYYTGSIAVNMGAQEWSIPDSYYAVGFDSLYIRTDQHRLVVEGLRYAPDMSRQEFYQRIGLAKEMVQLDFGVLDFRELDLRRFARSQRIHAGALHIKESVVDVSNDRRYPRITVNKIGQSPHQLLMRLNHPVMIDSIFVESTDIRYSEISERYHKEGEITFQRTAGWLANVTNDSIALTKNHVAQADLTTYVQNQGQLHAQFTFDMLDKNGAFTYKGTLGPMDGRAYNRILTPLLSAEVASANIKGMRFDMQGEDYRNWGSLWLDYDDVKINLLETHEDGSTSRRKLVSFLANELLINSSNPDHKGDYHVGRINYQRPPHFSFFKTLWKSLLEGIKQAAGISKEREEMMLNTAESARTIQEKSGGVFQSLFRKRDRSNN